MTTKSTEIQARLPATSKRIFLVSLFIVALGILESGCSVYMWREGWAIQATTLDAYEMADYRRPVASKMKNGDVVFKYDVRLARYGVTGTLNDNQQVLGLERITNIVSGANLHPITQIWSLLNEPCICPTKRIYPIASDTNAFVRSGQSLPILKIKLESNGSFRFPAEECVVWDTDYIWYTPPLHTNDVPKAAILSQETIHTPGYLYPVKVVLFPFFVLGDMFYVPIMYFGDH
jgi:hypothetical protein